jgi:cell wall-associated NlpC family hydrolase
VSLPCPPNDTPSLQPGDLVFFGSGLNDVTHVGIAISPTQMDRRTHVGEVVRIDGIGGTAVGATRPSNPARS